MTLPILRAVPEQLETQRLLIRCPRPGDGAAVYAAVLESLPELRAWGASLPWALGTPSVDLSETFCRESYASYIRRTNLALLLFSKSDLQLVGASGLHRIDWAVPKFEIGYWCRSTRTGN
jgi:hypothetical protein